MKQRIVYGVITGLVYAISIALIDFFRDIEFDSLKFILGVFIFGMAMIIASKINNKKDN